MVYKLPYRKGFNFTDAEVAKIAYSPWYPDSPRGVFQAAFIEGQGMLVQITSYEKNPLATFHHNDDPVWTDSCVECFVNFAPDRDDRYLNIEVSAGGGVLIGVGPGREDRLPITDFAPYPKVTVTVRDESWDALYLIPLSLIEAVYGKIDFKPGYAFKGNFNMCREEGWHYCQTWNPIETPRADFHRPEFFGDLILE